MRVFLCVLLIACSGLVSAQVEPDRLFFDAQTAYDESNFEQAVSLYEQVVEAGHFSPELFYNLGNTYWQKGDVARASLNFRRAQRLMPGDADLKNNYTFVREQSGAVLPAENPVLRLLRALRHDLWMGLAFGALIVTPLLLLVLLLRRSERGLMFRFALIGGLVLMVGLVGGHFTAPQNFPDEVVVMTDDQEATYEPLVGSKVYFTLPAGSVAVAEARRNGQVKIRSGKEAGWIPEDACLRVALGES